MQFLWKYIDELVGKGLGWVIISKLMLYASATLVPLALPLALLLSSIMTFGNMAEHYELVALKSAGLSLQRIMRPLIVTAILISAAAFYFSNNVMPIANFKMYSLIYDVRQKKPALSITEGIFYQGIDGYVIRVGKKDSDGKTLRDVMIYDHTDGIGNNKMIMAERGLMVMSDDERSLILTLYKGNSYEEQLNSAQGNKKPLMRTEFDQQIIRFDLSAFKMHRTDENLFRDNYQMLNLTQLDKAIDSIQLHIANRQKDFTHYVDPIVYSNNQTHSTKFKLSNPDFIQNFDLNKRSAIISSALASARNYKSFATDAAAGLEHNRRLLYRHEIEWNRKFSLSFACLILFFIGAPLGAIIRKGGLGLPVIASILFFVLYHIITISCEKMVREGVLPASQGMWISSAVLFPLGVFLTYKATTDSALFSTDAYLRIFQKILPKKK